MFSAHFAVSQDFGVGTSKREKTKSQRKIQGKVEQLQTCLLFHTCEVSQQVVGRDLYGLQNGGCFTSTFHISQESLSCLTYLET